VVQIQFFQPSHLQGGGDGGIGNGLGPSNPVNVNANGIPGGSGGGGGTFNPGTPGQGTVGSGNTPPVTAGGSGIVIIRYKFQN
jgi:hypothetical protein